MAMEISEPGRRRVLRVLAVSLLLLSNRWNGTLRQARAESAVRLSPDNPAAKSLNFVYDAAQANRPEKSGVPGEQQFCRNCRFLRAGQEDWRPCSIYGGKLVNVNGWCSAWSKVG